LGKSQETFNKKEKEKKRLQKRREKDEKKEQRKASAKKGKTLEEMMAYVDENGRITSTPPDPKKKKVFKVEDIELGVAKRPEMDPVRKGKVSYFNDAKGYGFIRDEETQESIFVHMNGLLEKVKELDKVTFEVEMAPKGPSAVRVKKIA
jgi:cold shock CspA family protein